jgi:geranylgeranyl diphosphate synthase type II
MQSPLALHTPCSLSTVQSSVETVLSSFVQSQHRKAVKLHPSYGDLWESIGQQLSAGGKRLRPYLLVLSYEAYGGEDTQSIMTVAAAWEMLHNAMLMHDDIIDRDYVRHGVPNIAGQYLKRYQEVAQPEHRTHYANAAALLAGDLALSSSFQLINQSGFSSSAREDATELLQEAIFEVIGGELLDSEVSITEVSVTPELIAEAKTASYTLVGPLQTGASLAGASPAVQAILRQLGRVLGIGYQLVDDILGIYGNESQTGKSVTSDLSEGKHSFVVDAAFKIMNQDDRNKAAGLLKAARPEHVAELRSMIDATNVRSVVAQQLDDYRTIALQLIAELQLPKSYNTTFTEMVGMLLERVS